jgi:hypothetical protein
MVIIEGSSSGCWMLDLYGSRSGILYNTKQKSRIYSCCLCDYIYFYFIYNKSYTTMNLRLATNTCTVPGSVVDSDVQFVMLLRVCGQLHYLIADDDKTTPPSSTATIATNNESAGSRLG